MKKIIAIFWCCCLSLLTAGCQIGDKTAAVNSAPAAYEVIDQQNHKLSLPDKPQRILAVTMGLEEILVDLVKPDRIVAISNLAQNDDVSLISEKARLVAVQTPEYISTEGIVKLNPDLIIITETIARTQFQTLTDMGFKVFVASNPHSLAEMKERIIKVAEAVGEPAAGQAIVGEMEARLQKVRELVAKAPESERPTVVAYSATGAFGRKNGAFDIICELAGVKNGAAPYLMEMGDHLSKEQIFAINPDYFIFPRSSRRGDESMEAYMLEVRNDPAFAPLKAVQKDQFLMIADRYRYCNSQHIVEAVEFIAGKVYGKT